MMRVCVPRWANHVAHMRLDEGQMEERGDIGVERGYPAGPAPMIRLVFDVRDLKGSERVEGLTHRCWTRGLPLLRSQT